MAEVGRQAQRHQIHCGFFDLLHPFGLLRENWHRRRIRLQVAADSALSRRFEYATAIPGFGGEEMRTVTHFGLKLRMLRRLASRGLSEVVANGHWYNYTLQTTLIARLIIFRVHRFAAEWMASIETPRVLVDNYDSWEIFKSKIKWQSCSEEERQYFRTIWLSIETLRFEQILIAVVLSQALTLTIQTILDLLGDSLFGPNFRVVVWWLIVPAVLVAFWFLNKVLAWRANKHLRMADEVKDVDQIQSDLGNAVEEGRSTFYGNELEQQLTANHEVPPPAINIQQTRISSRPVNVETFTSIYRTPWLNKETKIRFH